MAVSAEHRPKFEPLHLQILTSDVKQHTNKHPIEIENLYHFATQSHRTTVKTIKGLLFICKKKKGNRQTHAQTMSYNSIFVHTVYNFPCQILRH